MRAGQRERARLPGIEIRKRLFIRIDVVYACPAGLDRGRKLLGAGEMFANQHLVAHDVRHRNRLEQAPKQVEGARLGQADQGARVDRYESFRHASTALASSATLAREPRTKGMPSLDAVSMNCAVGKPENRAAWPRDRHPS